MSQSTFTTEFCLVFDTFLHKLKILVICNWGIFQGFVTLKCAALQSVNQTVNRSVRDFVRVVTK